MLNFFLHYLAFSFFATFGVGYAMQTEVWVKVDEKPWFAVLIGAILFSSLMALKLIFTAVPIDNLADILTFFFFSFGTLITLFFVIKFPPKNLNAHYVVFFAGIASWAVMPFTSPGVRSLLGFE